MDILVFLNIHPFTLVPALQSPPQPLQSGPVTVPTDDPDFPANPSSPDGHSFTEADADADADVSGSLCDLRCTEPTPLVPRRLFTGTASFSTATREEMRFGPKLLRDLQVSAFAGCWNGDHTVLFHFQVAPLAIVAVDLASIERVVIPHPDDPHPSLQWIFGHVVLEFRPQSAAALSTRSQASTLNRFTHQVFVWIDEGRTSKAPLPKTQMIRHRLFRTTSSSSPQEPHDIPTRDEAGQVDAFERFGRALRDTDWKSSASIDRLASRIDPLTIRFREQDQDARAKKKLLLRSRMDEFLKSWKPPSGATLANPSPTDLAQSLDGLLSEMNRLYDDEVTAALDRI
ncbi:uncharacterized protein BJ171DRAFT_583029 [Polychytrium aggregatum]|uniref:uncharacterized protein n=1 Tax=Polychytrium aggregatum TaxID=110093 RepID=UPI0022FEA5BB|nr:uncharacterized protein BJ171DRAFT_583029 [Polychytrium aggregatum]KAI9203533.1 hypothetical protein BJ171DRAFT_583029 [Polychytrium aggregatum]